MVDKSTLAFLTESLPAFTVGQQSSFTLQATGGTEPYTFSILSGTLPQGLSLERNGEITGTPKEESDVTVLLTVTDANDVKANQAFQVFVQTPQRG